MEKIREASERISKHFCNTLKSFFIQISKVFARDDTKKDFIAELCDYVNGINLLISHNKQEVIVKQFNKHFLFPFSSFIDKKNDDFFIKGDETKIDYADDDKSEVVDQIRKIKEIYMNVDEKTKDMVWDYVIELKKIGGLYNKILERKKKLEKSNIKLL